jgi:hypothetical protein
MGGAASGGRAGVLDVGSGVLSHEQSAMSAIDAIATRVGQTIG